MFYLFNQNNSGGYYMDILGVPNVAKVFIEANNSKEALYIMQDKGLFDLPYCECCGERFYAHVFKSDIYENVLDPEDIDCYRGSSAIVLYKNGQVKRIK